MKFFWKIFLTVLLLSVFCVSLSGAILLYRQTRSMVRREMQMAGESGEVVLFSLDIGLRTAEEEPGELPWETVRRVADGMRIDGRDPVRFRIIDARRETVFSSLSLSLGTQLLDRLREEESGWTVLEQEGKQYMQALRPFRYRDALFYIETVRDVTAVFEEQGQQYKMMIEILLVMMPVCGIVTFIVSKLLMRRVQALDKITRTIADGNLAVRAEIQGSDEIANLSESFNRMTDSLEDKLGELRDEAERKELFVGAFSHELRTPLTSIIGYADLLLQKKLNEEQRGLCAGYIFSEGKRLALLSERLLEMVVLNKRELKLSRVGARALLEKVYAVSVQQLVKRGIDFDFRAEDAEIEMEEELMETVLLNLLDNAGKAIDGNGRIQLTGRKTREGYAIRVQDNGRGMEKAELGKITEAFYRIDRSRARGQGGAGLGLALCREIVALHGFTMEFESKVGEGTTVTLKMPKIADGRETEV